jgi:hypothetical protein
VDELTWSSDLQPITLQKYTEHPGPRAALPSSPLGVFSLFFTSSLLQWIVLQTNQYALWPLAYPVIVFSNSTDIYTSPTIVPSLPGDPGYDKLGKIKPILERVRKVFRSVYCPPQNISIDEAMIPFKGRSTLKQYMPLKPVKRGIKVWAMSDAVNGYVSEFQVYTGKKKDSVERNLGSSVVKTLTQPYYNTYRHLYFDNFFSSIQLLLDLLKSGLYGCGTTRTNRKGFPAALKPLAKKGRLLPVMEIPQSKLRFFERARMVAELKLYVPNLWPYTTLTWGVLTTMTSYEDTIMCASNAGSSINTYSGFCSM